MVYFTCLFVFSIYTYYIQCLHVCNLFLCSFVLSEIKRAGKVEQKYARALTPKKMSKCSSVSINFWWISVCLVRIFCQSYFTCL